MSTSKFDEQFKSLDLGAAPATSVSTETIEVVLGTESGIFRDYAKAFTREAWRVNPLRAEQVKLTDEEMVDYVDFLLEERIKSIDDNCPEWRKLKTLYIPSFVQYALAMVGYVHLRDRGLILKPVKEKEAVMTLDEAFEVSNKISQFQGELSMVADAMPRGHEGDVDTMSCILTDGYVRSMVQVEHPVSTYVAAWLGSQLAADCAFHTLYRVQYDDIQTIAQELCHYKPIFE